MIHVTSGLQDTHIGHRVTVGHRAILHGCTVEDEVLIGMGAIVLDGATIGAGSLVGANALVTAGTKIPPNSLVLGSPGKVVKQLEAQSRQSFIESAAHYVEMAAKHRDLEPI
jgi:carbonic anhydrase/acetyltransferase-like protein (isoleucine patch superfamily)